MLQKYYQLTKPGIIYGNLISATAGFLLASTHSIDLWLLLATLAGTSLVIASGCVFNNYLDRHIDKKMARTKKRALVIQTIPVRNALIFASLLGLVGFAVLSLYTNWLVVVVGLVGFVDYVVLYGYSKRHSVHSTLVGTISGATPVVAGYCAASGRFDTAAVILFLILATWQMAHFYGIAMYRRDDYKAAGIPLLSVVKGMKTTKLQTTLYIVVFVAASSLLTVYGYTGYVYLVVMLGLGLVWLYRALSTYNHKDDKLWGKKTFLFSLIVLMVTSVMLSVGTRLP
jgi:protoheme IX farnesyltransferase